MTQPNDFDSETPSPEKQGGIPKVLLIIGAVGCGCLGLPIILGIIAAIALPSFLNQASKTRESEVTTNLGAMLRGQQAYYLDSGQFSNSIVDLGVGISPETENYSYNLEVQPDGQSVKITATAKSVELKSYTGAVFLGEETTFSGICASNEPSIVPPAMPTFAPESTELVECPPGSVAID